MAASWVALLAGSFAVAAVVIAANLPAQSPATLFGSAL
jgi:hypothetical protein